MIIFFVALGNALLKKGPINYARALPMLLFACGLFAYSWYRYSASVDRALEAQNAARKELSLESDGVHLTARGGATIFFPWSGYSSWIEAKNVFVLTGENGALILPRDEITSADVKALLKQNIS